MSFYSKNKEDTNLNEIVIQKYQNKVAKIFV